MSLTGTKALESWCKSITASYENVNILNMTTSWRNGLGFCAIIHHHAPHLLDFYALDPDDVFGNNSLAFSVAEQQLGVPALLDPQDMVECELLDRLSILTYLAQYHQAFTVGQAGQAGGTLARAGPHRQQDSSTAEHRNIRAGNSELCRLCNKPVFILERLTVGGRILHRTCFKCARCSEQLTLASFYETESGQFCCEVCPDEEDQQRARTLKVSKDLARLMAGESGDETDQDFTSLTSSVNSSVMSVLQPEPDNNASVDDLDKLKTSNNNEVKGNESDNLSKDLSEIVTGLQLEETDAFKTDSNVQPYCDSNDNLHLSNNNPSLEDEKQIPSLNNSVKDTDFEESVQIEKAEILAEENTEDTSYPEESNPFGEEDEDSGIQESQASKSATPPEITSSNPFGSDDDDDEEEESKVEVPSTGSTAPYPSSSLNPFGSDLSSDEEYHNPKVLNTNISTASVGSRIKRRAPPPPSHSPARLSPVPAPRTSIAKRMKDEDNLNRQSAMLDSLRGGAAGPAADKAEEPGQWRRKKGPAPPRPIPPKRAVKKVGRKAINQELFDIEIKQGGLERQGVKLEKSIREICAVADLTDGARDSLGPEAEDLIIQLFDLVNEKNELFRRQTELIYMKKESRLEEQHADYEYQIRVLMSRPECQRTDDDKLAEEKLISKLVQIVAQRNEIVDCLEMDRLRERDEDSAIEDHMSNYAAVKPMEQNKKGLIKILKRRKKKKLRDDEKDVDTSELANEEKKEKSKKSKIKINIGSKKLTLPKNITLPKSINVSFKK